MAAPAAIRTSSSSFSSSTHVSSLLPRLRIVAFNDVYELNNLPRVQTFLSQLTPAPSAVVLCGDFLSPSPLSALDAGKGMVETLRAVGVSHVSLGNHEADLKLPVLEKRLRQLSKSVTILNTNVGRTGCARLSAQDNLPLKDNGPSFLTQADWVHPYSLIRTPCQRVQVALVGLLTDEPGIFRDGTFRGQPLASVLDAYQNVYRHVVLDPEMATTTIIPLTHQTMARDRQLAECMLTLQQEHHHILTGPDITNNNNNDWPSHERMGLILGGHEHSPHDEMVTSESAEGAVRIIKSGSDAQAVSVIDLTFDQIPPNNDAAGTTTTTPASPPFHLVQVEASLIEMSNYAPSVVVTKIVDSHVKLLHSLEHEEIVHAHDFLPPGVPLSSERTRFRQTTVGGILCLAMKEELEVDAAMVNGATIKGDFTYATPTMSYAQLKKELPFPTKMVVVPMKRWELQEAIHYSRTALPEDLDGESDVDGTSIERKGYLQVDFEFDRLGFHTGDQDDVLHVALPRNLLTGFCDIKPLMQIGRRLKEEGQFPGEDDFVPAIDLVIRHFSKERWYEIVHDHFTFDDLDLGHKGYISRDDVKLMMTKAIGHEPPDFVIDDMIAVVDADHDGTIDPGEFSHLIAEMEREHGLIRFD